MVVEPPAGMVSDEMRGGFGAGAFGIYRGGVFLNQVFVEGVFEVALGVGHAEQAARVGIVFAEQQFRLAVEVPVIAAQVVVLGGDGVRIDDR